MIIIAALAATTMQVNPPAVYQPETARAIAQWINPQFVDATGAIKVGLAAYHLEGIDRVEFYAGDYLYGDLNGDGNIDGLDLSLLMGSPNYDGYKLTELMGNWGMNPGTPLAVVTSESFDPASGELGYWMTLDLDASEGWEEISAVAIPHVGINTVMQGSFLDDLDYPGYTYYNAVTPAPMVVVGVDYPTLADALNAGELHIYLPAGEYTLPGGTYGGNANSQLHRYFLIEGADGAIIRDGAPLYGSIYYKNLEFLPLSVEAQEDLVGMNNKCKRIFRDCRVVGFTQCLDEGGTIFGTDLGETWAYDSYFSTSFNICTFRVGVGNHIDYIIKDINKSDKFSLHSGNLITNHGYGLATCIGDVHPDYWQTTGGAAPPADGVETDFSQYNKIFRFNSHVDSVGGQKVYGSFRKQEKRGVMLSTMNGFAFVGNDLIGWEDVCNVEYRAYVWFLTGPSRNFLVQDNIIGGKLTMMTPSTSGVCDVFDGSTPRRYHNYKWDSNFFGAPGTFFEDHFSMPMPDAPAEFYPISDDLGNDLSFRFKLGVDTFPFLSELTGTYYVGGNGTDFGYKKTRDACDALNAGTN